MIIITFTAAAFLYYYAASDIDSQAAKGIQVIFIPKVVDEQNDFWVDLTEGAESAATENNMSLSIMGADSEADVSKQNYLIEKAITLHPDAIALAPADYEETIPYAEKIEEAGIKLVLIDSVMSKEMGSCSISTDNYEAGYKMGQYAQQYTDADSVIGVVGHIQGTSTALQREDGLRAGLGDYQSDIVDVVYCNSDYEKAYEITCEMLQKYPSMNEIFGLNEYASVGAALAVKDMGFAGKIHIVGFDSSQQEVQLLEEGVFDAIVVQKPFNMGYLGISMLYDAVVNDPNIPETVDSGSTLVTKDTIYTEENEKLLFRFQENEE